MGYKGMLLEWNEGFRKIVVESDSSAIVSLHSTEDIIPENLLIRRIRKLKKALIGGVF